MINEHNQNFCNFYCTILLYGLKNVFIQKEKQMEQITLKQ